MPLFRITSTIDTTVMTDRQQYDYPSLDFAKVEARSILSQLASGRLPLGAWETIAVEIYDEAMTPLTELRLQFTEIVK